MTTYECYECYECPNRHCRAANSQEDRPVAICSMSSVRQIGEK